MDHKIPPGLFQNASFAAAAYGNFILHNFSTSTEIRDRHLFEVRKSIVCPSDDRISSMTNYFAILKKQGADGLGILSSVPYPYNWGYIVCHNGKPTSVFHVNPHHRHREILLTRVEVDSSVLLGKNVPLEQVTQELIEAATKAAEDLAEEHWGDYLKDDIKFLLELNKDRVDLNIPFFPQDWFSQEAIRILFASSNIRGHYGGMGSITDGYGTEHVGRLYEVAGNAACQALNSAVQIKKS